MEQDGEIIGLDFLNKQSRKDDACYRKGYIRSFLFHDSRIKIDDYRIKNGDGRIG